MPTSETSSESEVAKAIARPLLPSPNPEQASEARQVAAEIQAQTQAFPPADEWQREFPDIYQETPDGKWRVPYRNPSIPRHQQDIYASKAMAMIRGWQACHAEAGARRDASTPKVAVRTQFGVELLPAGQEASFAANGVFESSGVTGRRERVYPGHLFANGHTHIGNPLPWVRETCPGCKERDNG